MNKRLICALLAALAALLCAGAPGAARAAVGRKGYTPIANRAQLEEIAENPQGKYVLTADIDLGDAPWQPIPFDGVLDGGGHTIYNICLVEVDSATEETVDGNHKKYDTVFSALFSRCRNADISSLTLLNVQADLYTDTNCFVAGLIGFGENVTLHDVSVSGYITLRTSGVMGGAAGVMGYGCGALDHVSCDVTLVYIDECAQKCEEFMGGITACGYPSVERANVTVKGYASVHGYVHNGGIIGMAHHPNENNKKKFSLRYNTVDVEMHFFEDNDDRRAYCKKEIGENLHALHSIFKTTVKRFVKKEYKTFDQTLLPDMCQSPVYNAAVTPPTKDAFGYTVYTCQSCGYQYTDLFVAPTAE